MGRTDNQLIATRRMQFRSQITRKQERGAHQPALKPLMLVNSQKSGHLGQGCSKDWTHISSVAPQNLKNNISQQPHSNLGWRNAPYPSLDAHRYTYAPPRCRTLQYSRTFIPLYPSLVAHYAPPRCRTLQYSSTFIPFSVSLWNDLANPVFDSVGLAGFKSRANASLLAYAALSLL